VTKRRVKASSGKPKRKPGGQSKLTPELQEIICGHIRNCATYEVAAQAAGVTGKTLRLWRQWGEEGREPYAQLSAAVACARAQAETDILAKLRRLDDEDLVTPKTASALVRSLTWLMETTRRERYGQTITVKVEEAKASLLDILHATLTDDAFPGAFAAVLQALESHGGEVERDEGVQGSGAIH